MTSSMRRVPLVQRALVASSAGRRGRHVLALAGASDWRRALIDTAGAALINTAGTARLPAAEAWRWPHADVADIGAALAARIDGIRVLGAVLPRQPDRQRLSLLAEIRGNGSCELVVVKLGLPDTGIEREAQALRLLAADPLPCIRTPQVIDDGTWSARPSAGDSPASSVAYIVTTALAIDAQRAALDEPLRTFEHDLAERLGALDRPDDTPADHVPVHGDLTPWNLRRTPRGLVLFDWEEAGWGPAGSDLEAYRQACGSLPRRRLRR